MIDIFNQKADGWQRLEIMKYVITNWLVSVEVLSGGAIGLI